MAEIGLDLQSFRFVPVRVNQAASRGLMCASPVHADVASSAQYSVVSGWKLRSRERGDG